MVRDVGDHPPEHGVAEELEALVGDGVGVLGDPRAVGQRFQEDGQIAEPVTEAGGEAGEVRFGRQDWRTRAYT
jgi:hypothetical protein